MANYNPRAPYIVGNEWVPIRDEDLIFNPTANSFERGYGFTLSSSTTLNSVRAYIHQMPDLFVADRALTANVYPQSAIGSSGPVRSVVVPCNNGIVTGGFSYFNASSVADALQNPSSNKTITLKYGGGLGGMGMEMFFGFNQYAQLLQGKRILGMNFLFGVDMDLFNAFQFDMSLGMSNDYMLLTNQATNGGTRFTSPVPAGTPLTYLELQSYKLGDANRFFLVSTPNSYPNTVVDGIPWTYNQLARFEMTSSNRLSMYCTGGSGIAGVPGFDGITWVDISYAAIEVFYCEETRVAFGTRFFNVQSSVIANYDYEYGANQIQMYSTGGNPTTNPVLPAGDYYITLQESNLGDDYHVLRTSGRTPKWNEIRQYYSIPSVPGIQLNLPFPLNADAIGTTITTETTALLPQISMHASGGVATSVVTASHAYGRQAAAQVYDATHFARQRINDGVLTTSGAYPWIRFLARRFGNTTGSLIATFARSSVTTSTASITVSAFDALTEIVDGWKAVDLRFDVAPTLGTTGLAEITWATSVDQLAGNRWEVLGATALSVTGLPGNELNLVASNFQLGPATYGAPVSGAIDYMTWMPWLSPYVSGSTADPYSDATVLLSLDPPTVTGFTVAAASQPLTGIGLDCGLNPAFIPSALSYVRMSWSAVASSIPTSGFGYYEIQRQDSLTSWQTIAYMTSPAASGFFDYEGRIGLQNDYRIRAVNYYGFYGSWSSTQSLTMAAPGVTGTGITADDKVLVFTTNQYQNGSQNLAYCMAWQDGDPVEGFVFPEAGFTQLQPMYSRDFFTAFRPTERGGEQFTRDILVQAAAIAPETLADFTSLRNMAWASIPYVCVRDEDGNRWLANVTVPAGRVLRNRKLYLASIGIVEVTETAAPATV